MYRLSEELYVRMRVRLAGWAGPECVCGVRGAVREQLHGPGERQTRVPERTHVFAAGATHALLAHHQQLAHGLLRQLRGVAQTLRAQRGDVVERLRRGGGAWRSGLFRWRYYLDWGRLTFQIF